MLSRRWRHVETVGLQVAVDFVNLLFALLDESKRLTRLREQLDGCIGCGCLSLGVCPLRNPGDKLSEQGPGPRLLDPC